MNKTLTSRDAILSVGKEIVIEYGIQAINMRDIAHRCGVSVGSIYNYFPSKEDLIVATIESVWTEIMYSSKDSVSQYDFVENVLSLFNRVQAGCQKYPSFFSVHAMSFSNIHKNKGRDAMNQYFNHIKKDLMKSLNNDTKVVNEVFIGKFTKSDFIDFVFSNIITLLMNKSKSCHVLLEIIRHTIY